MTKDFLPLPNPDRVRPLLGLDRSTLTRCFSFLTGHNNHGYHRSLREPNTDNLFRFCYLPTETAAHLYAECPICQVFVLTLPGALSFHASLLPGMWTSWWHSYDASLFLMLWMILKLCRLLSIMIGPLWTLIYQTHNRTRYLSPCLDDNSVT